MDDGATFNDQHPAHTDAALAPAAAATPEPAGAAEENPQPPNAWIADRLAREAQSGARVLLYVASSERRADEIGRALRQFAPEIEVLVLPPWDCLPYDRASPSREAMGRRMAVLAVLATPPAGPRVLVASAEALMQRVPPKTAIRRAFLAVRPGEPLDRQALEAFALRCGYVVDDRIDEPGEIAMLGEVIDIFPAAADAPVRIALDDDGRVGAIRRYDPVSQRTDEALDEVLLGPASEVLLDEETERTPGIEHRAAAIYGRMQTVFALLGQATAFVDHKVERRVADLGEQIVEAYEAQRSLSGAGDAAAPRPEGLYLSGRDFEKTLGKLNRGLLDGTAARTPRFALERNPGRAFSAFVQGRLEAGVRVVLTGLPHELRPLTRAIQRGAGRTPAAVDSWAAVHAAKGGDLLALAIDIEAGFEDADNRLTVISAADVLGGRVATRGGPSAESLLADPDLRVGDAVIHEDHGLGVLEALETLEVAGETRDAVRLGYHGGANLITPVEEFGKLWRYSGEPEAVTLDRLQTDAWTKRRVELSGEIDRTAEHLVAVARARAETKGEILEPPRPALARFAARFPYPETPDQAAAIDAVLADLASGRVMSRLVCGDVGFGKTEVALRAAAAAALAGRQVAVVAPTTVLARQHYESFRRRFAGFDLPVGRLSRLASPGEAQAVKAGLADGSVRIVVGTHALAAQDVAFADLGLLIIDEEQRFGAKLKQQLRDLAPNVHLLTMTATPIPRTLQLAMVGIEDVSVIATPPARRRPVRTFLAPFDAATVRTALLRERRRGGQSFVVVPRIEDIGPVADQLKVLVPELSTRTAHGDLPPDAVDEVMVGFASGEGDVLLATSIIESGLDVPRANTMIVWRADRFGLAQLHQLRGRVGRGRTQGITYLLTDPEDEIAEATRSRLSTLVALDRLGSGLAISARDLELRGAGDLIGDEQAGHVKLIGAALYQRLLTRAVQVAKGEISGPDWEPDLNLDLKGAIPEAYVPDPTIRLNLYARLARIGDPDAVDAFAEELEDRFGALPDATAALLDRARLRTLAQAAGVIRVDAGPRAVALTFQGKPPAKLKCAPDAAVRDGRLVWLKPAPEGASRLDDVRRILEEVAARRQ